jgi:type IV pilus assembly protein PilV
MAEVRVEWRRAAGFTLVEVLVALFVLAVGIVGASATQLVAQRSRHDAAVTADAARLAASLAGRMRANPAALGAPDDANPYLVEHDATRDPAPGWSAPCFGSADCTPLQMAQFDIDDTIEALHQRFPGGRLVVCRDASEGAPAWRCAAAAGAPLLIKLGWRDNLGGGEALSPPRVVLAVPGAG